MSSIQVIYNFGFGYNVGFLEGDAINGSKILKLKTVENRFLKK